MKQLESGGQWPRLLLLAAWSVFSLYAQSPNDAAFLSTLGELREATYSDKATIVERLAQGKHPSLRAVLTALLNGRLYYRNSDPLQLVDPISLKDAGSAPAADLTAIGTNNSLRSVLRTTVARFALSSPS